jgi:hypothetical protein
MAMEENRERHGFVFAIDESGFDAQNAILIDNDGMWHIGVEAEFLVHFYECNPRLAIVTS